MLQGQASTDNMRRSVLRLGSVFNEMQRLTFPAGGITDRKQVRILMSVLTFKMTVNGHQVHVQRSV